MVEHIKTCSDKTIVGGSLFNIQGGLLLSQEMAENEALSSCDRYRFLVGISNLRRKIKVTDHSGDLALTC